MYYLDHGQYSQALAAAARSTTVNDTPPSALNVLGVTEMMTGSPALALASFNRALALDASLTAARLNRGVALMQLHRNDEAVTDFASVYAGDPALRAPAAYQRALAEEQLDNLEGALLWLNRALQADPGLTEAIFYRGIIEERRGNFQEAGRDYKTFLQLHPESAAAMLRFGIAAQRSGHADTARRYFQQVLDTDPFGAEAVEARKFMVMWD
ncbi:MAG: tetratricopeptide repeat protein [Acidobacteriota bacterium]